ncbi:glycosyl hydrolase family 76-domain-containing protein [Elsinoe ampelina]|uniref:Glycosyl hydrolase family 76-domain-containing protein n=1 Tax=Elsinoe ampelina TaxID=302913 RepID=A0A6A6G7Y2_9PEZI|nr:glycosyl hydrolase family 76-domain-containing protein [Elsinoe ampelina]
MRVHSVLLSAVAGWLTLVNADLGASSGALYGGVQGYSDAGVRPQDPLLDTASRLKHVTNSDTGSLQHVQDALKVMQDSWYQLWVGTWPTAIDWTAAVINTYVTSTLMSLSKHLYSSPVLTSTEALLLQSDIDKYFAHNTAFYFGENAFAIRNQAFDDMLWVVLGWLQSIKFITSHNSSLQSTSPWHATQFIPALAHRARIFYDLAAKGWDTRLCNGGMTWNPSLAPYKNAITNQLFISASISMYLHFPGDDNSTPFLSRLAPSGLDLDPAPPHSPTHLTSAITAYTWLRSSNMTNHHGLYVDGFHVSGWSWRNRTGTGKCDDRNEMVYTYNQGVILSGLRGLWESTANVTYLLDAHALITNVMTATGFSPSGKHHPIWSGLGRSGILEDHCDARGTCNQDGHTFKGIFFQHLTHFCQPLPVVPRIPGRTHRADAATFALHRNSCLSYAGWVGRNARAAWGTRDGEGRMGPWWTVGLRGGDGRGEEQMGLESGVLPAGAVDYRNRRGLTRDEVWTGMAGEEEEGQEEGGREVQRGRRGRDLNDRGRGRTVESHGGGLVVLRAAWEFGRL